jgi:transposase InsO family protein
MDDHATEVALWRYGIIAPLLAPDLEPAQARAIRQNIIGGRHVFPGGGPTREISSRTLRRWLSNYRRGGFEGLKPGTRKDRGRPRRIEPEVLGKAVALREEVPERSARQIIDILTLDPGTEARGLKRSTLARHLSRMGKTRRLLKAPKGSFRRYEKDRPNAQWQSDVWYGPYLPDPRDPDKKRRTYLIAFLDDHSRLITHGAFYGAEDLPSLLDCLKKAILKRGLPARLYCDNGATYTSRQFSRIVAELGIHHLSARPYAPEGRGKIERFWLTVDSSFLPELKARPAGNLEELNALFAAWLEQGYHHWTNRETGETPAARFARGLGDIRLPDPARLVQVFLWKKSLKADKTSQLSLEGNRYEVDPRLARRKVELRYDPFDLSTVQVWCDGRRFDDARPYDLVRQHDRRVRPQDRDEMTLPKTGLSYLDLLLGKHEAEAKTALGRIAFHRPEPKEDDSDV